MPEATALVVIADTSGSMCEMGKRMLVRNLLAFIRQDFQFRSRKSLANTLQLLAWGIQTVPVRLDDENDIPSLDFGGKASVHNLLPVLTDVLATTKQVRVLLLSDGQIHPTELAHLRDWLQTVSQLSLRAVAIGPDADLATLRKVTGRDGVFPAEEIIAALDPWPVPPANQYSTSRAPGPKREQEEGIS